MMSATPTLRDVHDFWNSQACGTHYVEAERRSREFFERYCEYRYSSEWHLPEIVGFTEACGLDLLEIGCGNGADGATFARYGAHYTGVDLTEEAVEATREHFRLCGLDGDLRVENAECLGFADNSFDMIYSHGVLHHMPDPNRGFAEVFRLLRPGGRMVIMLYHRHSFNYYVRIMGYMRLRLVARILARVGRWGSDRGLFAGNGLQGLHGNTDPGIWDLHYRAFLRNGWGYLSAHRFVHHATDGPECPYAHVYTRRQVKQIFSQFAGISTRVAHLPIARHRLLRWLPRGIERLVAARMGWYLFIFAQKPE